MFGIQFDVVVLELLDDAGLGEAVGDRSRVIVLDCLPGLIAPTPAIDRSQQPSSVAGASIASPASPRPW